MAEPGASDSGRNQEDVDGCGLEVHESDITLDTDLPVATGGVEIAPGNDPGEEADGCDLDFEAGEATSDADLPASAGGVA